MADRVRRSRVIAACLAVWSLATMATGLATGMPGLFATRMLTGIGEAGYAPAGNALVGDAFDEKRRGRVMGWISVAGLIGPIGGLVLGGLIAGVAPGAWRLLFLITGIPGMLVALLAWWLRVPARDAGAPAAPAAFGAYSPTELGRHLAALGRNPALLCLVGMGVLTTFTATALQTYFPILLQQRDAFGMTSAQAASYAGLVLGPTAIAGVILGGYLADRLQRRLRGGRVLVCTASILVTLPLNIASLVLAGSHDLVLFSAVLIPAFFVNTLHIAPLAAALLDVVPAARRASAIAVATLVQRLGGTALAPLAIGALAARFDPSGQHFAHAVAGHDIVHALLATAPLAFAGAGLLGLIAHRWAGAREAGSEAEPDRPAMNPKYA